MADTVEHSEPHTMQCLEVWGGNEAVDHGVVMPGLDAWLYSRPFQGHSAGGDLHYMSSCAAGMITRVLVADVSGHGEAVAEIARKLRRLMRRYVNFVDQTRFVRGLNEEFGALSEAGGFATAVVVTYRALEDELSVSNAGHPKPLYLRSRSGEWSLLSATDDGSEEGMTNVPLGIAEPTRYDQFDLKFATGDMLVLYTDALIEAKSADGRMLGTAGLLRLVQGLDASDPGRFLRDLLDSVGAEVGGAESDDVTVLILRANALKPRPSMATGMRTGMRMMRAMLGRLVPGAPVFPWPESGPLGWLGTVLHRLNPRWGA